MPERAVTAAAALVSRHHHEAGQFPCLLLGLGTDKRVKGRAPEDDAVVVEQGEAADLQFQAPASVLGQWRAGDDGADPPCYVKDSISKALRKWPVFTRLRTNVTICARSRICCSERCRTAPLKRRNLNGR